MSFGSPLLLLVTAVVPATLALALWLERRRSRHAVAFTNLDLLASVVPARRPWRRWVPLAVFLLALVAASAAVARPRAVLRKPASQATVVLLVDVSGSMRAADVKPTRLGAAQTAMHEFADHVPGSVRLALISFSNGPDVLVPPTTDRGVLREGIDLLAPDSGTAIGDGLGIAVRVARAAVGNAPRGRGGKVPAAIVLLSDGAQTRGTLTPLQAAAMAKAAGIRVFTVALGTDHGVLTFPALGAGFGARSFPVKPDPVTLAAIARATDGQAFRAQSAARVSEVYRELGASIVTQRSVREISSWFAGAAALLLLASLGLARATGERLP